MSADIDTGSAEVEQRRVTVDLRTVVGVQVDQYAEPMTADQLRDQGSGQVIETCMSAQRSALRRMCPCPPDVAAENKAVECLLGGAVQVVMVA